MSTELSRADEKEIAGREAWGVQNRIKQAMSDGRDALWRLAEALYEFDEMKGWEALGYDNKHQWLGDADITLSRTTYDRYVRTWRKLVVERQIPAERLRQLEQSKVAIVTDAIVKNEVVAEEALSDAEVLPARDLREKYYGLPPEQDDTADSGAGEPQGRRAETTQDESSPDAPDWVPPVDPDSDEPMTEAELQSALAEEQEREENSAPVVTTATVNGEVVQAEVVEAEYDFPGWMTKGAVQTMLDDINFGLNSGATYPRLSRQGCQVAQQLGQAWLSTRSN